MKYSAGIISASFWLYESKTAAEYLRELCAMIPDKHDQRHIKYNRQLLQVEARINKNK